MPTKISITEIRPSTDIGWTSDFYDNMSEEFQIFRYFNNPNILENHSEISEDGLIKFTTRIINDDYDKWNGVLDQILVDKFIQEKNEYTLRNNLNVTSISEQLD